MPITEELKTAQELRAAGLTQRLAELLAAKLESTAQASRDSAFRDFQSEMKQLRAELHAETNQLRAEMTARFEALVAQMAAYKADTEKSIRASQGTLLTAILGAASVIIAVAVALKLF